MNATKAFLSRDIKINSRELRKIGRTQISRRTYDSQNLRADILFSFHGADTTGRWENYSARKRGCFLGFWLANIQRKKEFQTEQHSWSSVRSTLVRTLCLKKFGFLAIWYRNTDICSWIMSSSGRESSLPCFNPLFIGQVIKFYNKRKTPIGHKLLSQMWQIEISQWIWAI